MSHARIEEVSDSDPSEGDISDVDSDFDEREILKRLGPKPSEVPAPSAPSSIINPSNIPSTSHQIDQDGTKFMKTEDESKYKDFQCVYPIYFDKNRSRKEGRRVGVEQAVENPMAREIVNACGRLRLETLFEPAKTHPKDWANPGRIKIKLKGGDNPQIKNSGCPLALLEFWYWIDGWKFEREEKKEVYRAEMLTTKTEHHLYTLISQHLQANPTSTAAAINVRVPGVPPPDASKPYPKPAVPKGWKMNDILPYYSPGLTGGGVSDNIFKDMMAEMQGAGGMPGGGTMPGMPDMSALQGMMGTMGGGAGAGPSGGNGGAKKEKKQKKVKG
jgi:signal recognition particle subunit SRP19